MEGAVRHLAFAVVASLGLTACSASQMQSQNDDQACHAKGYDMGTAAYADCRAALDKQRTAAEASAEDKLGKRFPDIPGVVPGKPN
jgi:hypothetical protein